MWTGAGFGAGLGWLRSPTPGFEPRRKRQPVTNSPPGLLASCARPAGWRGKPPGSKWKGRRTLLLACLPARARERPACAFWGGQGGGKGSERRMASGFAYFGCRI
ncbi:hypothetical protein VFPFJ_02198 [Purpureocillium lilacinum]|uniref:Uncharacterized protein n=1 Tax=Purpureocillium lilacinum TaxID=33203 RepID=A0A179GPF3_PURLI|nr:hypothetical protein VFPFJ_02198 [Purpureocillium lilacinum]OAQ79203.1 hypothetical protein VFPBJ_07324 [Purpureocillium lilacinum]OAQ93037.1 hypothetical protein VFPFJ_02198 [Purpureocillium lilacinum]